MSDSDGSPKRDERHHRRSRSRSSVSPGWPGEILLERGVRQLAGAAIFIGQPAKQPQAARSDPELPAPEPMPAREAGLAAQAAAPAAPPPRGAPDTHGTATAAPASYATALGTLLARGTGPTQAPGGLSGTAAAASEGREGTKYRTKTKPRHTHVRPPSPTRPRPPRRGEAAGVPRPDAQAHADGHRAAAAAAARGPGGRGRRTGGAGCKPPWRGARGWRRQREGGKRTRRAGTRVGRRRGQQRKGTDTSEGTGRSQR